MDRTLAVHARAASAAVAALIVLAGCSVTPGEGPTDAASSPGSEGSTATPTDGATEPAPDPSTEPVDLRVALEEVGNGFDRPLHAFGYAGRTYVVEQVGRVTDLESGDVWLDITDRVVADGEGGLLGVAVHPSGGHIAVHYNGGDGGTRLATYLLVDGVPDVASERILLRVPQPAQNHNGGSIVFAPDGMAFLALGDGGGSGDAYGNGQNVDTLLGALLRLDLHDPTVATVPADNPFVDGGGAPEIWAYGVRNPYRIAFGDGQVYIADVGQNAVEEITVLRLDQAGANLGWPEVEGDQCYRSRCDVTLYEPADVTYKQFGLGGCAVIGGEVYAGSALPALTGHFVYGDLCAGILRTVRAEAGDVVAELDLTEQVGGVEGVTSVGADADGELLLTFGDGRVLRLVPAG